MIPKVKYYGPRIPSTYAVNMTAAGSGSNGITVADDDDIDFGTGDFFLHWEGSLPDWTPASEQRLIRKNTDSSTSGVVLNIRTTGIPVLYLVSGGVSSTQYAQASAVPLIDGALAKITAVVVRESASVAGSVTFYVNGTQLGLPVAITAGTPFSVSNALSLYVSGSSSARTASNTISCIVGNFAPTASEVLDLCANGIPESWKWGSQTDQAVTSFSNGAGGTAYGTFDTASADGFHAANATGGAIDKRARGGDELVIVAGKKYRVGFAVSLASGQSPTINIRETYTSGNYAASAVNEASVPAIGYIDFVAGYSGTFQAYFRSTLATDYTVSGFYFKAIGVTFAALPSTIPTSGALEWPDSSGNTGGGTLPAAGATKVTIRR